MDRFEDEMKLLFIQFKSIQFNNLSRFRHWKKPCYTGHLRRILSKGFPRSTGNYNQSEFIESLLNLVSPEHFCVFRNFFPRLSSESSTRGSDSQFIESHLNTSLEAKLCSICLFHRRHHDGIGIGLVNEAASHAKLSFRWPSRPRTACFLQ